MKLVLTDKGYGHLCLDGTVLLTTAAVSEKFSADDIHVVGGKVPAIPRFAVRPPSGSRKNSRNQADVDFYDFRHANGALFVAAPSDDYVYKLTNKQTLVAWEATKGDQHPSLEFNAALRADARGRVPKLLVLSPEDDPEEVASMLLAEDVLVSACLPCPEQPAPTRHVNGATLRWTRDSEVRQDIGAAHALFSRVGAVGKGAMSTLYDANFHIERLKLKWMMFASSVVQSAGDIKPDALSEPIASYAKAFQAARRGDKTLPPLKFNTASKLTAEQAQHALCVFYWTAVHAHAGTRPLAIKEGRAILDMYAMQGHVLLFKRNYTFHGTGVGKRGRRVTGPL